MSVRGHIEGGGTFELSDANVHYLRQYAKEGVNHPSNLDSRLAAALPPEPYEPKVGDWVQYRYDGTDEWSRHTYEYRGEVDGKPVFKDSAGCYEIADEVRPAPEVDR